MNQLGFDFAWVRYSLAFMAKPYLVCLTVLAALLNGCADQSSSLPPINSPSPSFPPAAVSASAFPSTTIISLQAHPNLSVGFNQYLAYFLPANLGGREKFKVVPGLAESKYVSFESVRHPGFFLRHQYCQVKLDVRPANDSLFASDATFIPVARPNGGWMFRAYAPFWLWLSDTRDEALYVAPNPQYADCTFLLSH